MPNTTGVTNTVHIRFNHMLWLSKIGLYEVSLILYQEHFLSRRMAKYFKES